MKWPMKPQDGLQTVMYENTCRGKGTPKLLQCCRQTLTARRQASRATTVSGRLSWQKSSDDIFFLQHFVLLLVVMQHGWQAKHRMSGDLQKHRFLLVSEPTGAWKKTKLTFIHSVPEATFTSSFTFTLITRWIKRSTKATTGWESPSKQLSNANQTDSVGTRECALLGVHTHTGRHEDCQCLLQLPCSSVKASRLVYPLG